MTRIEFIHKYANEIALITEPADTYVSFGRAIPFDPDYDASTYDLLVSRPTEPLTHMMILGGKFDNDLHEMMLGVGFELANIVPIQGGNYPKLLMSYRVPAEDVTGGGQQAEETTDEKDAKLLFNSYISRPVRE